MDATPSPDPETDDSSGETRIYIDPSPDNDATILARFRCELPDGVTANGDIRYTTEQHIVISRIEIQAPLAVDGTSEAIGANVLRRIPTGGILTTAMTTDYLAGRHRIVPKPPIERRSGPGRAPITDDELRELAIAYLEETAPGMPRGAIGRLSERMDKPTGTISRWVSRAREAGWLGPTIRGREGGEPGPRLIELMADDVRARLTAPPKFTEQPEE